MQRYAKILSLGVGLPRRIVTNQDIINQYNLTATSRAIEYTLGIKERRWISNEEKVADLIAKAISDCLIKSDISINQIDRLITTKLFGDFQVPAVSIGALRKLGASKGIPAFDISAACSGFIHAMDLAIRYINSGDDYVLIVGGSASGKLNHNLDRSNPTTCFLFGDAMVAMLLCHTDDRHFLSSYIITNHQLYDKAYIKYGSSIPNNTLIDQNIFNMNIANNNIVFNKSVEYSKIITDKLLKDANFSIYDIDYFVTSDQTTKLWAAQLEEIGIPKFKSCSQFRKYGNTVSAMSPLNLLNLIETERLKRGKIVMMQAHGAGASSGGMIFKY